MVVAVAKPIQKNLLDRLVIGHHYVADGVAADEVADFLRQILGVVPRRVQAIES